MKLKAIILLGIIFVIDRVTSLNLRSKSNYEELMLNKNAPLTTNQNSVTLEPHLQTQNRGFPDRLLLPRGWTEGMPMQLFTMITPFMEKSRSIVKEHSKPSRKKTHKCIPDGKAFGFPFDRPVENEQNFQQPNMYFKDVKIYHDDDYLLRNFRAAGPDEKI